MPEMHPVPIAIHDSSRYHHEKTLLRNWIFQGQLITNFVYTDDIAILPMTVGTADMLCESRMQHSHFDWSLDKTKILATDDPPVIVQLNGV